MSCAEKISELYKTYPGRRKQIDQLFNLFAEEPYVDLLYVWGGSSTGKTQIVKGLLSALNLQYVLVDMIECFTAKSLYQSILTKLIEPHENVPKCDSIMDLCGILRANYCDTSNQIVVIDNAEKLLRTALTASDCGGNPAAIIRLRELTTIPHLTIILISQLPLQKFYANSFFLQPLKIHFPQYEHDEFVEILCQDYSENDDEKMMKTSGKITSELYRKFILLFLGVFYRTCRDLVELRHCATSNFVRYCEPIVCGEIAADDPLNLWRRFAPHLKHSLDGVYLRSQSEQIDLSTLELPLYGRYLLIAAFLASYNPAKDDKRLFVKNHDKKRKTLKEVQNRAKVSEELNTQLGPKAFSLDRLLAIFYAILDHPTGFNSNLLVLISTLVELEFLIVLTDFTNLSEPKYKCNVDFEFIQAIAQVIGFNMRKYLSDFCHI